MLARLSGGASVSVGSARIAHHFVKRFPNTRSPERCASLSALGMIQCFKTRRIGGQNVVQVEPDPSFMIDDEQPGCSLDIPALGNVVGFWEQDEAEPMLVQIRHRVLLITEIECVDRDRVAIFVFKALKMRHQGTTIRTPTGPEQIDTDTLLVGG